MKEEKPEECNLLWSSLSRATWSTNEGPSGKILMSTTSEKGRGWQFEKGPINTRGKSLWICRHCHHAGTPVTYSLWELEPQSQYLTLSPTPVKPQFTHYIKLSILWKTTHLLTSQETQISYPAPWKFSMAFQWWTLGQSLDFTWVSCLSKLPGESCPRIMFYS